MVYPLVMTVTVYELENSPKKYPFSSLIYPVNMVIFHVEVLVYQRVPSGKLT